MYTLEKHLHLISTENPQFEVLDSMWKLNRNTLTHAQNAISFNFPHYSMHEKTHSDTIIKNIESFLGEDRIKQLSPTDTWLILMAAHTHDLGMVVFHKTLEKKWQEDEFQKYLKKLSESSFDKDLQKAANIILNISNLAEYQKDTTVTLPLDVRNAVILITADFFRRNHHFRSKQMLSGKDEEFATLINNFNLHNVPNRFSSILGEIAYAHGIEYYDIFDRLEYCANGYGSDKMHPRFIACLLRLGDLLDVDDKRFNNFYLKVFSEDMPETSQWHKDKHASVKHLLVSPNSIEVTVDCPNDNVYRVAKDWFDFLQTEVENQGKEWSRIAPQKLMGMPPTISRGKIKVLYKNFEPKAELMNLKFAISNEKVFEMFEGSAIYRDTKLVFLRELVQNALDATKIQLWKHIKSGIYNKILTNHLCLEKNTSVDDIINRIKFPTDIPDNIWENYPISLNINWDKLNQLVEFSVQDKGTGISEKELIRMTQKVGESRSNDTEYHALREDMPYWLQPTGAFGIGLQSIFLVTDSFTVYTKPENEDAKEIIFHSSKKGDYSRLTGEKPNIQRGTIFKLYAQIDKLKYENDNSHEDYNFFDDKYGDVVFHIIADYIKTEFSNINLLDVSLLNYKIKEINSSPSTYNSKYSRQDSENKLNVILNVENDTFNFKVYENTGIGSDINIDFLSFVDLDENEYMSYYRQGVIRGSEEYLVRNIPVSISDESTYSIIRRYFNLRWNFESPKSDKLLNISRDSFIQSTKRIMDEHLDNSILPRIINFCIELFEEYVSDQKTTNEYIAAQYFHLELTALMLGIKVNHLNQIYKEYLVPTVCTDSELKSIKYSSFFSYKNIIKSEYYIDNKKTSKLKITSRQEDYEKHIPHKKYKECMFVWSYEYFNDYFDCCRYYINEITSYNIDTSYLSLTQITKKHSKYVKIDEFYFNFLLTHIEELHYSGRGQILPLEEYKNIVIHSPNNQFYVTGHNNCIISPFNTYQSFKTMSVELLAINNDNDKLSEIITSKYVMKYVSQNMINWIQLNSVHSSPPTKEQIIVDYSKLIYDYIKTKQSKYNYNRVNI